MLNEIERQILETVIKRLNVGKEIAATRIIEAKSEYERGGNYIMCRLFSGENTISFPLVKVVGFSKRNPRDRFVADIGRKIAFSRAAKSYVRNLVPLHECRIEVAQ